MPRKSNPKTTKPLEIKVEYQSIWENFTEHEMDEITFATMYSRNFAHGTSGHNQLMLIAKLAQLLADLSGQNDDEMLSLEQLRTLEAELD